MELNIADSIRSLRQEKGITQEELANAIGVTAQAVSKWERGEGYPDITFLPDIAEYFHVTLDVLCGMDKQRKRLEISSIITTTSNVSYEEGIRIAREGVAKYPHSITLKLNLALALMGCTAMWAPPQEVLEEVTRLYEDILNHSPVPDHRILNTMSALCEVYELAGNHEKAIDTALQIPGEYERNRAWCRIVKGEELISHIQNTIIQTFPHIHIMIKYALESDCYTTKEKIALCRKMIGIYALLDECSEWPIGLIFSIQLYLQIAVLSTKTHDTSECLKSLDKAACLAVRTDSLPHEGFPTSLLLNRIPFETLYGCNEKETLIREMEAEPAFESLRKTPEYRGIIEKLKQ